ncbi:MAG: hypothetical protein JWM12_2040 [Ilumatobacteraceae bacterium]|nr:hypothetical protein [Ilumatobacteraceae bacterium]
MTNFRAGDRIRVERIDDDGLPLVRYGFVGGIPSGIGPIVVMLDGDLNGSIVEPHEVRHVELTTVELNLNGADLLDDPELRRGLVALWQAEADTAGLEVGRLRPIGDGLRDSNDSWALAELTFGEELYVVHAIRLATDPNTICVRADQAH